MSQQWGWGGGGVWGGGRGITKEPQANFQQKLFSENVVKAKIRDSFFRKA
jgi:hypothetical protein